MISLKLEFLDIFNTNTKVFLGLIPLYFICTRLQTMLIAVHTSRVMTIVATIHTGHLKYSIQHCQVVAIYTINCAGIKCLFYQQQDTQLPMNLANR